MKKFTIILIAIFFSIVLVAQDQTINGNVTINGVLDVREQSLFKMKSVLARLPEGGYSTFLGVKSYSSQIADAGVSNVNDVKSFSIEHIFHGNINSSVNFYRGASERGGSLGISVHDGTEYFRFSKGKLDVNGTIRSKEVKIEATGWSDFVFDKSYQLPTLSEVESHISQHKHLPDIPSQAEVIEQGINVGEMQAKLLQKIEELTLYVIQQEKKIAELEKKVGK